MAVGAQRWSGDVVFCRAPQLKNDNDGRQKANRDTGVARCREVSWSRWLTRARRSPRSAPPNSPGSPSEQLVTVVTLVITAWSRNSPDEPPVCARICKGIAVRASELSICAGRICVASAGEAYALALLAISALGESVSLSDKTKPGR
jgi:hypothetical protein